MIVSRDPSVWPFVARALGFEVLSLCTESVAFKSLVGSMHRKVIGPWQEQDVSVVFGDWSSLSCREDSHWDKLQVPHVGTLAEGEKLATRAGWHSEVLEYSHARLGGLTAGIYRMCLMVPGHMWEASSIGTDVVLPELAPSRLWTVLESTIAAEACLDEGKLEQLTRPVPWIPVPRFMGKVLDPRGVTPAEGLEYLTVLAPCVYHRSKWGLRRLTVAERAGVFDVPILVQEKALKMGEAGTRVLDQLSKGHPGKVLHLGTDHLLSKFCRGGWTLCGVKVEEMTEDRRAHRAVLAKIRRAGAAAAAQRKDEVDLGVKEEGQKADEAAVPTEIWDAMWMLSRMEMGLELMEEWWGRPYELDETSSLPRWRWSLEVFRNSWLIFWWRRWVTRSLCKFLRVRARAGVTPKQMVWWEGKKFAWCKEGKQRYKQWWEESRGSKERRKMVESGIEALSRVEKATWWEWAGGSSLFFWNWPQSHVEWAREGQPHFVTAPLPESKDRQMKAPTEMAQELMNKKVNKVRQRCYICAGVVICLTNMFSVLKGLYDIRMIYDGTKSGLNACLFAPHFSLPVMVHTLRSLQEGYFSADLDVGEMFLNWWMGIALRPYAGVDIRHVRPEEVEKREAWDKDRIRSWERWVRNFMGMKDSPYRSLQMMIMAKFVAYGDRRDRNNPFQWESVVLNLPGDPDYDPSLPWVMKVRIDGHLACEVYVYVDDGKFTGWSKLECWRAAQRFSKTLSRLGIQDAYRKRTGPSTKPGPWAGTVTLTEGGVFATVTELKWKKTQGVIKEIESMMEEDDTALPLKRLCSIRGFLIYVGRTYRWMNPYLKGLHLVIDGWRSDRALGGYKKSKSEIHEEINLKEAEEAFEQGKEDNLAEFGGFAKEEKAPEKVSAKIVPRFYGDVVALVKLTEGEEPATQKCRVKGSITALYVAGDASGKGFGAAVWDEEEVVYSAGSWSGACGEESSNWREAENLTLKVEEMAREGRLRDRELWIFTDNSTYEGTFFKGYSSSEKLTAIIFRLRMVERETGCIIHVIHIAGTRMKEAGIDGLSRQDFVEGIMGGANPWSYIPLNEDADSRTEGRVSKWVNSWWCDEDGESWCAPWKMGEGRKDDGKRWESERLVKLTPEDWFSLQEVRGHRLWIPPPAAMETVMELFAEDHLVNPHLAHVFIVPRLMTHLWRKHMFKDADIHFYVQAGAPFWPRSMHEPLTVVAIFPLSYVSGYRGPWIVRDRPGTGEFAGLLDSEYRRQRENGREEFPDLERPMPDLQEDDYKWTWNLLRKFLHEQRTFPPVQSGVSRGMLPGLRGQPFSSSEVSRRRGGRRRTRVRG